jgi:hypothetical protein
MEFFYDSKPNLIGPKIKMHMHNILKIKPVPNKHIGTVAVGGMKYLYNSFIKGRVVLILTTIIITILLIYRYVTYKKQKNIEHKSNIMEKYEACLNEAYIDQIKHIMYSDQPSIDPTKSVNNQDKEITNYPPTNIPINLSDGIVNKQNIYPEPTNFELLNTPNYNYEAVHYNPRSYYNGTYNTYENSVDSNIQNSIGLPVNFNTTTEKFVKYATDSNNDNLNLYQSIIDNKEYNMSTY